MWHELVVVMVLSLVNLPFPLDTGDPAACLRSHRDNLDVSHVSGTSSLGIGKPVSVGGMSPGLMREALPLQMKS